MTDDPLLPRGWDLLDPSFYISDLPFDDRFVNRGSIIKPGHRRPSDSAFAIELTGKKQFDDGAFAASHNVGPYDPGLWPDRPPPKVYDPYRRRGQIAIVFLVLLFGGIFIVGLLADTLRAAPDRDATPPAPRASPTGTTTITRLTPEEVALFEVSDWELWRGDPLSALIVTLAAPGLERPLVSGRLELTVHDADGRTHTLSRAYATLTHGEPVVVAVQFLLDDGVEVVDLEGRFRPTIAYDDVPAYVVEFADEGFGDLHGQTAATGTLTTTASSDGSPRMVVITTIVRNADGEIRNVGVSTQRAPAPGESNPVMLPLLSSRMPQQTDVVTHQIVLR